MSVENPWRDFIENCINGSNYFRMREYMELLADLDRGYDAEADNKSLRSRLAEAEALLRDIAEMRVPVLPSMFMDESMAEAARAFLTPPEQG
jgi:uncharacterized protein involved in exopolysaccharide biosynthesis